MGAVVTLRPATGSLVVCRGFDTAGPEMVGGLQQSARLLFPLALLLGDALTPGPIA